ncbi:MAG: GNAT family N-acetyltransferase [Terriglobales bacterium]
MLQCADCKPGTIPRHQIENALATVYGVDTQLIADRTYFVAQAEADDAAPLIVGCGGWSKRKTLYGGDQWTGREATLLDPQHDAAKIRAFFIHPSWARRGIGSLILEACENAASRPDSPVSKWGPRSLECCSTRLETTSRWKTSKSRWPTGVPSHRPHGKADTQVSLRTGN